MEDRLDIIGNIVCIGDEVAYNPPRWKGLVIGNIIKFTPKGFTVLTKDYKNTNTVFDLIKCIKET